MGKVSLLDCTLRDGGYINDWRFGEETIKGFGKKIAQTGIEMFEVGFIKGDSYDKNRSVFPNVETISAMIQPKAENMIYVGMLDMSAPIPLERFIPYDGTSIDGIRVIFKKDKADEAYRYCQRIMELGYMLFVNFVGTDLYTDKEFIEAIERFNTLHPYAMTIVDTFGLIKRKQFLRLAYLADNNLAEGITLCYHAHNNLQQAFGNAEALVELNLKRDICIDACVFGMGRGAGNLNLELFAEYMNENYDMHYRIEPMLEIMDEYLNDIYKTRFWGYSLPLYLSANAGCHPNYAIYLEEKDSLTVRAFNELLRGIPKEEKEKFSKEKAEQYYREYQENFIDDRDTVRKLSAELEGKSILLLAPGKSLAKYMEEVKAEIQKENTVVMAVNFASDDFRIDYIFSSNMRRYHKIQEQTESIRIITSNMKEAVSYDYVVNFASYASNESDIIDNSGIMALKLLIELGVKSVRVAGMDGYSGIQNSDYYDRKLDYDFSSEAERRNQLISNEIEKIRKKIMIHFLTPTYYEITDTERK